MESVSIIIQSIFRFSGIRLMLRPADFNSKLGPKCGLAAEYDRRICGRWQDCELQGEGWPGLEDQPHELMLPVGECHISSFTLHYDRGMLFDFKDVTVSRAKLATFLVLIRKQSQGSF